MKQKIMLDVGCGENPQEGFIGMDKRNVADIVHDAEIIPWPIKDKSCAVVVMSHFIEHVKPWLTFDILNECWRILDKGVVLMSMPYGTNHRFVQDPTHCNPWNEITPLYFVRGSGLWEIYKPKPWTIEKLFWNIHGDIELAMRKDDTI